MCIVMKQMILDHRIHLAHMMSPEEITNDLDLVTTNGAIGLLK